MALDIHENGLSIPSFAGDYDYPNGFLYSYFLALCFAIFGVSPVPVYLLQGILLGLSVALIYFSFKNKLKPVTGIIFLITLFIFAFLDVHKYYTFRFLSENLVIPLIALFFYFFIKGMEKSKTVLFVLSGLVLGLCIMTRPNLLPVGIVILLLNLLYCIQKKVSVTNFLLFCILFLIGVSLLGIRNLSVTGNWTFFPINSFTFFKQFFFQPDIFLSHVWRKFLFCFGYLPAVEPMYHWRPHWTFLFLAYFYYLFLRLRERRNSEAWEGIAHVFILTNFFLLTFVINTTLLSTYGFRYNLPMILITLPFAFMVFERGKIKT
jgi:4-amino-4-deoxy-L-arabinose transferase-like glycosyltransferase